jgi:hypothetical protein
LCVEILVLSAIITYESPFTSFCVEKNKSRDIICCLHKKIRTLKQSLKLLLMAAILGKLLTKNRQFHNLSDIIIEEIVCRNTCFECNYNIWITFYIFLWNYESIKVGVQLVFITIWEWHRFTAVIWKNDAKSFMPYGPFGQDQKWLRHTFWTVKQIANITSSMFSFIFLTEQLIINGKKQK